ncbi:MAG: SDR family NAD(P)-dependent oxidoreductase [Puniceicoccaceae bacterium]
MGDLKGKRALVTAGGQGIGLAISEELAKAGCDVCIHYFSSAVEVNDLHRDWGLDAEQKLAAFQADLCSEAEATELVGKTVERLGGLDILINNAGSLVERRLLGQVDEDIYRQVMDLNLASMAWVTREAASHLKAAGEASIVNLASLAGRKGGHPGSLLYSTAKGAVLTWTRALATELAPDGIRVNAVAPGLILGTSFHATHTTRESAEATIQGIPLGRAGNPGDVARAVRFFASEYDGFTTGATLDINGGVYSA